MPKTTICEAVLEAIGRSTIAPPARVLDLSCGEGNIIARLAELGYAVEGTHYRDDDYIVQKRSPILERVTIHKHVDLVRPLPFADASYDVVLATEVLEHLPSHASILAESGRLLSEGGLFVFTTPNIHRLSSRLQFLLTGMHNLCGARFGWHIPPEELYATHFNPVYFPTVHGLLRHGGLRIRRLGFTTARLSSYPLALALYPLVALATWLEAAHYRKRSRAGGRDLLRWMLDPKLLLSDQLVVVAEKPPAAGRL